MRKLLPKEYLEESEKWFKKNGEYYGKLTSINRRENRFISEFFGGDIDLYLDSDKAKEFNKERDELKSEYKGFVSEYTDCDFYCVITLENIDELIDSDKEIKKTFVKELTEYNGKLMTDGYESVGIFEGIADCVDDYYYLLRDTKDKSLHWCSCVGAIYPYEKEKSYKMVTNGKEYL